MHCLARRFLVGAGGSDQQSVPVVRVVVRDESMVVPGRFPHPCRVTKKWVVGMNAPRSTCEPGGVYQNSLPQIAEGRVSKDFQRTEFFDPCWILPGRLPVCDVDCARPSEGVAFASRLGCVYVKPGRFHGAREGKRRDGCCCIRDC